MMMFSPLKKCCCGEKLDLGQGTTSEKVDPKTGINAYPTMEEAAPDTPKAVRARKTAMNGNLASGKRPPADSEGDNPVGGGEGSPRKTNKKRTVAFGSTENGLEYEPSFSSTPSNAVVAVTSNGSKLEDTEVKPGCTFSGLEPSPAPAADWEQDALEFIAKQTGLDPSKFGQMGNTEKQESLELQELMNAEDGVQICEYEFQGECELEISESGPGTEETKEVEDNTCGLSPRQKMKLENQKLLEKGKKKQEVKSMFGNKGGEGEEVQRNYLCKVERGWAPDFVSSLTGWQVILIDKIEPPPGKVPKLLKELAASGMKYKIRFRMDGQAAAIEKARQDKVAKAARKTVMQNEILKAQAVAGRENKDWKEAVLIAAKAAYGSSPGGRRSPRGSPIHGGSPRSPRQCSPRGEQMVSPRGRVAAGKKGRHGAGVVDYDSGDDEPEYDSDEERRARRKSKAAAEQRDAEDAVSKRYSPKSKGNTYARQWGAALNWDEKRTGEKNNKWKLNIVRDGEAAQVAAAGAYAIHSDTGFFGMGGAFDPSRMVVKSNLMDDLHKPRDFKVQHAKVKMKDVEKYYNDPFARNLEGKKLEQQKYTGGNVAINWAEQRHHGEAAEVFAKGETFEEEVAQHAHAFSPRAKKNEKYTHQLGNNPGVMVNEHGLMDWEAQLYAKANETVFDAERRTFVAPVSPRGSPRERGLGPNVTGAHLATPAYKNLLIHRERKIDYKKYDDSTQERCADGSICSPRGPQGRMRNSEGEAGGARGPLMPMGDDGCASPRSPRGSPRDLAEGNKSPRGSPRAGGSPRGPGAKVVQVEGADGGGGGGENSPRSPRGAPPRGSPRGDQSPRGGGSPRGSPRG